MNYCILCFLAQLPLRKRNQFAVAGYVAVSQNWKHVPPARPCVQAGEGIWIKVDQGDPQGEHFVFLRRKIPEKKEGFLLQNKNHFYSSDFLISWCGNIATSTVWFISWPTTLVGTGLALASPDFSPRPVWRAFAKAARCWMFQCDTKWNRTWKRGLMINLILSSSSDSSFFWRSSVFLLNQQKTPGILGAASAPIAQVGWSQAEQLPCSFAKELAFNSREPLLKGHFLCVFLMKLWQLLEVQHLARVTSSLWWWPGGGFPDWLWHADSWMCSPLGMSMSILLCSLQSEQDKGWFGAQDLLSTIHAQRRKAGTWTWRLHDL